SCPDPGRATKTQPAAAVRPITTAAAPARRATAERRRLTLIIRFPVESPSGPALSATAFRSSRMRASTGCMAVLRGSGETFGAPGDRERTDNSILDEVLRLGAVTAEKVAVPLKLRAAHFDQQRQRFLPPGQDSHLLQPHCRPQPRRTGAPSG